MKNHHYFVAGLLFAVFATLFARLGAAQQSPVEELASMQGAENFDASLFASEPMITNPSAIDVDTHGRVWVAEIQWYRSKAKQPPADKLKVLEDTDGDGKADKVTVFAEGLFCPMSVCVAGDKVYVATSPDLWEYEDRNGDLKADGPPRKILTGFGGVNHDHGAHSLLLGPDHKWWMSVGDAGLDITGTDGSHIAYKWGTIVRGELNGSQLEIVASNFRNPYEICVNSFGEAYASDNDNDGNESTRFCWILDGGNYGWYGRPPARVPASTPFGEHWHFRGHIPGHVPALVVVGFGSPSGMCFYEGDAWGSKYKNIALLAEAGRRELRAFRPQNAGAGKKSTSEIILTASDFYFRPDDVCASPEGNLYVADWYDGGVGGHAYNNPEQGRILLLRPKTGRVPRKDRPGPYDNIPDAIAGLKSPNLATQYLARERLLAEGQLSVSALTELLTHEDPDFRARALWVLDRIGGAGRDVVLRQLKNKDDAFRALAIRILRRHGEEYANAILPLADDSSSEVTREVLLALRSIQGEEAMAALVKLAARYDSTDRYLLEVINIAAADRKQQLYERLAAAKPFTVGQISLVQLLNPQAARDLIRKEFLAVDVDKNTFPLLLACASGMSEPEAGKILLEFIAKSAASAELKQCALEAVAGRMEGDWGTLKEDPELVAVFSEALSDKGIQTAALEIVESHRLQSVDGDVLKLATNEDAPEALRCVAIRTTGQLAKSAEKVEKLRKLLADHKQSIREAALATLVVDMQDLSTAQEALGSTDEGFEIAVRKTIAARALDTPGGANMLLQLVEKEVLSPDLRQHIITKAAEHPDANVRFLFERFVPPDQRQKRLGEAISADDILKLQGDPLRGEAIFRQNSAAQCMTCHKVKGKGGDVGPALNTIGAKYDRGQLLETIMQPSKAISPDYVSYNVETQDGRLLGGLLVKKTDDAVTLKDAQGRIITIPADNVQSIVAQSISIMPELVLRDVSAQDAADLLAYLTKQR